MRIFGKTEANLRWFINDILALKAGQKIIDIGCGPGLILDRLPAGIEYVGVDISEEYVAAAHLRYSGRGIFIAGDVDKWSKLPATANADLVMAIGVLHHLDDLEAGKLLQFAKQSLKEGGRFVFYEPCYLVWQSWISKYLMSKDRGQNIRYEQEWKDLIQPIFPIARTDVVTGLNRLFYVCIVGQCDKATSHGTG